VYKRQIRKVVISTGVVTTLAGTEGASGSTDGTGAAARFNDPAGITTDGTNLYVADAFNGTIRKVVISTGEVTTLAGTAGVYGFADGTGAAASFTYPSSITTDGTNLYVGDTGNGTIRKVVISTGVVTTLVGQAPGFRFSSPSSITTDGTNLYVADRGNHTIRKVVISTGVVTTLVGQTAPAQASGFTFNEPTGITTDGTNLYVADAYNQLIRKVVIGTGVVTTLAGTAGASGSTDGIGAEARFYNPRGITTDGTNLYVVDTANGTIRKVVIATGEVTTLAGTAGANGIANGNGAEARFRGPTGITTDGTNLYVADTYNQLIRKAVIATGMVMALAGSPEYYGSAAGPGKAANFYYSTGITTDGTNLFVADSWACTIRKVVISTGGVTTLAGAAGSIGSTDGTGAAARFYYPTGITTDGTNLYVADTYNQLIRKVVIDTGVVTTLAGTAGASGSTDGTGAAARFNYPSGITTDGTSLYVADTYNNTIRMID